MVLSSRATLRTVVLCGLFGVSWLAGAAAAHANSGADGTAQLSVSDQPSPVQPAPIESVSVESEQAALATAIQLESDTSSMSESERRSPDQTQIVPVLATDVDSPSEQSASDTFFNARSSHDSPLAITSTNAPLAASDSSSSPDLGARLAGIEHVLTGGSQATSLVNPSFDPFLPKVAAGAVPSVTTLLPGSPSGEAAGNVAEAGLEVVDSVHNAWPYTTWSQDSAESLHDGRSEVTGGDRNAVGGETVLSHDSRSHRAPLVRFEFETSCLGTVSAGPCSAGGVSKDSEVVGNMTATDVDRDAKVSRVVLRTAWQGYESERMARPFVSPD